MDKNRIEILEQITALVDNELPEDYSSKLKEKINNDEELQLEFKIQLSIKTLLRERFASQHAPDYLSKQIMKQITQ